MEEFLVKDRKNIRSDLIHFCRWIWRRRSAVWSMTIFSILLNIFATSLFFRWPWSANSKIAENGSFVKLMYQNASTFLLCGIILVLLTAIIGLVGRLDEGLSNRELCSSYLRRMIRETEQLTLTGIPAGLIAQSVPLDEVYIPMQLRQNRPLTDYPLSEEQINYLRGLQETELFSETRQQILIEAKNNWYLNHGDQLSFSDFWKQLKRDAPIAVIQGYPGTGKSTLLARLMLYMARQALKQSDPLIDISLNPVCLPILLHLGDYVAECKKSSVTPEKFSLLDYLNFMLDQLHLPGLVSFVQMCLHNSRCLVMFDGLDEISDFNMRQQVQEAIKKFILDYCTGYLGHPFKK